MLLLCLRNISNSICKSSSRIAQFITSEAFMVDDSQIFVALLFALVSAVLAIRLGKELYQ